MKENIISKETSEKTVLVGLITPQQNEAKANEYLDELTRPMSLFSTYSFISSSLPLPTNVRGLG